MRYLLKKKKTKVIHLLKDNNDTYCRMSSTGGLDIKNYNITNNNDNNLKICLMCNNNKNKLDKKFIFKIIE